jgi:FtsH-binding integral membrane protein
VFITIVTKQVLLPGIYLLFWLILGFVSGPSTFWAFALPLESHPQPFLTLVIFQVVSCFLARADLQPQSNPPTYVPHTPSWNDMTFSHAVVFCVFFRASFNKMIA